MTSIKILLSKLRGTLSSPARRPYLAAAAVALAAAGVYGNSLAGVFITDDIPAIVDNALIKLLPGMRAQFAALVDPDNLFFTRPVTGLSFSLNYYFGRLDPLGYHVVNVLLHAAAVVLFFLLARRIVASTWQKHAVSLPLAAALLYAVHPVNAEVVAYASHRSASLMAIFFLGSLLLFARATEGRWLRRFPYAFSLACFVLAFLSHPAALTLPVLLVACDYLFACGRDGERLSERLRFHMPFLALLPVMLFVGIFWAEQLTGPANSFLGNLALLPKLLSLLLVPWGLSVSHAAPDVLSLADPRLLLSLLLLAAAAAAVVLLYLRRSAGSSVVLFGLLWCFVNLLPAFIFPGQFGERHLYLAAFGPALAALWLFARLLDKKRLTAAALLCLVPAALFAAVTVHRCSLYRDAALLWRDAAEKYPNNAEARLHLAAQYAAAGDRELALREYHTVEGLDPNNPRLHYELVFFFLEGGDYSRAWLELHRTFELDPDGARLGKDRLCRMSGMYSTSVGRFAEARVYLLQSIVNNPYAAGAHVMLGYVQFRQGDYSGAFLEYEKALTLAPDLALPHYYLGDLYAELKDYPQAVREYEFFLRSVPAEHPAALAKLVRVRQAMLAMNSQGK